MWKLESWLVILTVYSVNAVIENEFSKDFLFGAGSSAYQVEGAWNISDKGETIWDRYAHTRPERISDGSNGDVATDSYHKFKEDVQLLKNIGANTYRFSISWARILPDGFSHRISEDGVRYYNDLIDECISNGIMPMVTLYHWDLPQKLQDLGGWTNPDIELWFADYAEVAFDLFGDRVKMWTTINEPTIVCQGYGDIVGIPTAPEIQHNGTADYLCGHYSLLAHSRVYALYKRKYRLKQNGKVGIALILGWFVSTDNTSVANIEASERAFDFNIGWMAHPLFSAKGDYPEIMKTRISKKSEQQGYHSSRLPEFTREQMQHVRQSSDFLAINYYTTYDIVAKSGGNMGFNDDAGFEYELVFWMRPTKNTPWGLSKALQLMASKYQLPDIYVTENGYPDSGGLQDVKRVRYLHDHLQELLKVIRNGINIKGYVVWSLTDNFQWAGGYLLSYGIFSVDFNKTERPRTPKLSSKFITEVYTTRRIPNLSNYINSGESIFKPLNRILLHLTFCHFIYSLIS